MHGDEVQVSLFSAKERLLWQMCVLLLTRATQTFWASTMVLGAVVPLDSRIQRIFVLGALLLGVITFFEGDGCRAHHKYPTRVKALL